MPEPRRLDLTTITQNPDLPLGDGFRAYCEEAARFCLDYNGHLDGVTLTVHGSYRRSFQLRWTALPQESWRTYTDTADAVEYGAYGIAFMLVLTLTRHGILKRSARGTGFDFWLGERGALGFQKSARLEVSGVLSGPNRIASRMAQKIVQTKRSDSSRLLAYVVVVEFSCPESRITKR